MTDRPILFSSPMVQALLGLRKTQTRRLAAGVWTKVNPGDRLWVRESWRVTANRDTIKPRDLTVRGMTVMFEAGGSVANGPKTAGWEHDASWPRAGEPPDWAGKLRHSIFLPRWASRLTLTVTDVRLQRLHCISEEDAIAEGAVEDAADGLPVWYFPGGAALGVEQHGATARGAYRWLWAALHGEKSWLTNCDVAALSFAVEQRNIDA